MADPVQSQQESVSTTSTVLATEAQESDIPTLHLRLRKPKNSRKVQWTTETVDNEHLNKKKSKCCCIYKKPSQFGESSSSDSDDECEHCQGHVEKKKKQQQTDEEAQLILDSLVNALPDPPPDKNGNDTLSPPEPDQSNSSKGFH